MKKVHVVIGANYGDEGKGLVSRYFSLKAKEDNQSCVNVLFNGGAQRGHTVETPSRRFVSHHFGAGLFDDAQTYCDKEFILSPAAFLYDTKATNLMYPQKIIVHPMCRVSTLYDMLINRIVEDSRGDARHGSVGVGIWETTQRYIKSDGMSYNDMVYTTNNELFEYFTKIATEYVPSRLKEYGITNVSDDIQRLLDSKQARWDMVDEFRALQNHCTTATLDELNHDVLVFEAGQGLALSSTNFNNYPYVTTSDTGARTPLLALANETCDIEIDYVTRSYFTRHGAGPFPTECAKDAINPDIVDNTNMPGAYQGSLRYGYFDKNEFLTRVQKDIQIAKTIAPHVKTALFATHLNYCNMPIEDIAPYFDKIYVSNSSFAEEVKQYI